MIPNTSKCVGEKRPLIKIDGSINWCKISGGQFGNIFKNKFFLIFIPTALLVLLFSIWNLIKFFDGSKNEKKDENIVEVEKTNESDDTSTIFYEYDEAKLTKQEYQEYLKELEIIDIQKQRADIDYIALMSGIDLGV